jgi:hypothetical protein
MTRQELEIKAKEFDSKLKRHPMSSEELQKVLCDFVEALHQPPVIGSVCTCRNSELEKGSLVPVFCHICNAYVQTDL